MDSDKLQADFTKTEAAYSEAFAKQHLKLRELTDAVMARHPLDIYVLAVGGISPFLNETERAELDAAFAATSRALSLHLDARVALQK